MSEFIELAASIRKRFYEPVILLDSLRSIYTKNGEISEPDLETTAGKSPKQTYYCFLNKLSQICDSQPKQPLGKTVSAVVVLEYGPIEYRFASNHRDRHDLETVNEYLTSIIDLLGQASDDEVNDRAVDAPLFSGILKRVLAFNRPRIEDYIDALYAEDRLQFCIDYANADGANGESVAEALQSLLPHLAAVRNVSPVSSDAFTHHSEQLLRTIDSHYDRSRLEDYMRSETRGSDTNPDSPWREVRHALGRLLSYFIAIKVLISARKFWPQLFVNFEVTWIPSSEPLPDPPDIRRSADGIIRRMGRSKTVLDAYKRHAADLQHEHRLDERIRQRVKPANFRPIVHAEVNLLDSVLRDIADADAAGDDPIRFFNEAAFGRYIGTSKPTCLLCSLYFAAHPSGVRCRDSHGNLYANWRAPDVPGTAAAEGCGDGDEKTAERQRAEIMESMIKAMREETGRAITQRSYTRSRHDSRDTPTNPLQSTRHGSTFGLGDGGDDRASTAGQPDWEVSSVRSGPRGVAQRGVSTVDDDVRLAAMMGQVSLVAVSERGSTHSSRKATRRFRVIDEDDNDEEDGDAGGAIL